MARVLLFAALREAAGVSFVDIDAVDVRGLLDAAGEIFGPGFQKAIGFAQVAVNGTLVSHLQGLDTSIGSSDEVALLPPVSGGACQIGAV